jgi:hypothetical protein
MVRHYDLALSFPAAKLPTWAYVYLTCQLPYGGRLRGVTAVQ